MPLKRLLKYRSNVGQYERLNALCSAAEVGCQTNIPKKWPQEGQRPEKGQPLNKGKLIIASFSHFRGILLSWKHWTLARGRLSYSWPSSPVWPDVGIKIVLMFPKVAQKVTTWKWSISKWAKKLEFFWQLLHENLSPRTFKNRSIWSHWLHDRHVLLRKNKRMI